MNIPYREFFGPPSPKKDLLKDHKRKLDAFGALSDTDQRFALGVMLYEILVRLDPLYESFSAAMAREEAAMKKEEEAAAAAMHTEQARITSPEPSGRAPQGPAELAAHDEETADDEETEQ